MELALPPEVTTLERPMTVDEFMQLPEGPPYPELLDGELVMNAAPAPKHQVVAGNLLVLLHPACPSSMQALMGPVDWAADSYNVFEPDLLVVLREHLVGRILQHAPLLCVEILSPSTRLHDLVRKRVAYERAGVASYWIIDPEALTLLALELVDGTYVEVERPGGTAAAFTASRPFPVTIDPARLLD